MTIITRTQWGASGNRGPVTSGAKRHVFVHHSLEPRVPAAASPEDEADAMRRVARYHQNSGLNRSPGYSFVIMQSGRIFEGCGWGHIGAHTRNRNSSGYGICFFVDGRRDVLTEEAIAAFDWLAAEGVRLGHLHADHSRTPHSAVVNTECPGPNVLRQIVFRDRVPTGPAAAEPMPTLRQGRGGIHAPPDEREAVRQLQRLLRMPDEHRTGFFGPLTDLAVREYQQSAGLIVDGIVGPITWKVLMAREEEADRLADLAGGMGPVTPLPPAVV